MWYVKYIIALLATVTAVVSEAADRLWIKNRTVADTIMTYPIASDATTLNIEIGSAMKGLKDTRGDNDSRWTLRYILVDGSVHDVTVGWGNSNMGDPFDRRSLWLEGVNDGRVNFSTGVNVYGGNNTLIAEMDSTHTVKVYVGSDYLSYAGSFRLGNNVDSVALSVTGSMTISNMCIETTTAVNLESGLTDSQLSESLRPGQPIPLGPWTYLDRDTDAGYARPGGEYTLAIVADPDDSSSYLIIYISGARVNDRSWHPGMIKGRLHKTPFLNRYKLEWWDAEAQPVEDESNAVIENDIMTLTFPLHHSHLRFTR